MKTLRTGLIGANIGKSRFSDALRLLCADHGWVLQFELIDSAKQPEFDFVATLDSCRAAGWTGITVTHPFKQNALSYAKQAALADIRILGASNTLIFAPQLAAYNTDHSGFIAAWQGVFGDRRPGHVAMAGAGGVARALGPALIRLGASRLSIWDATPGLASELAARIGHGAQAVSIDQAGDVCRSADGLVNATPLGMSVHPGCAFAPDWVGGQDWAFDAVYTPTDTVFLQMAEQCGLDILSGFDLFRFMALKSFHAYTGITPDPAKSMAALATLRPTEEAK